MTRAHYQYTYAYQQARQKELFEAIFEVIIGDPRTQEDSRRVIDRFIRDPKKEIEFKMEEGKKWKIQLGTNFILTLNDYKI